MERLTCQHEGAVCFYSEHSCRELLVPVSVGNALGDFCSSSYRRGEKRVHCSGWEGRLSHAEVYLTKPPPGLSPHRALSYTKRFLVIGSLLRRLDIFVNVLRRRYVTTEDG
jgi:hypothetical protein